MNKILVLLIFVNLFFGITAISSSDFVNAILAGFSNKAIGTNATSLATILSSNPTFTDAIATQIASWNLIGANNSAANYANIVSSVNSSILMNSTFSSVIASIVNTSDYTGLCGQYGIWNISNTTQISNQQAIFLDFFNRHFLTVKPMIARLAADLANANSVQLLAAFGGQLAEDLFFVINGTLPSYYSNITNILQDVLNGVWQFNGLTPNYNILYTPSNTNASTTLSLNYSQPGLIALATGLVTNGGTSLFTTFYNATIATEIAGAMLANSNDVLKLANNYRVTNLNSSALANKIANFATSNYLQAKSMFNTLANLYADGFYYELGFKGANYAYTVLGA